MTISVYNHQKDIKIRKGSVRALVLACLSYLKIPFQEVSIYFVDKKTISQLHKEFFQDPTPTDCISFPLDQEYLGEIFVCPAVAIEYAETKKLDPLAETALYIIHGLLHLIGYEDTTPEEKRRMRKKEKSCMRHLEEQNLTI